VIVAIHQPQYLPWIGYFDKMEKADVFCFLDNVQYKKNEWQNRNRIKTSQGWQWVTVPVGYRFPQKINEVPINNTAQWARKHLQALITNYNKALFFNEYIGIFEKIYSQNWNFISEVNIALIQKLRELLGLEKKVLITASGLSLSEDPTERLIDICQTVDGDTYLSGEAGREYMNLDRFRESGIDVIFQDFKHPEYKQRFGPFESHLSIVDLLFNCGTESKAIMKACNP
jgi:hypothetical protein